MPQLKAIFLFSFCSVLLAISADATSSCSPQQGRSSFSCPPFLTELSYPFSSSPGCGHPSFQIRCSNSHSFISINNLTFALLHYDQNSSSLLVSPHPFNTSTRPHKNCSSAQFLSIPAHPIKLSDSSFRFSDSSCSRLSYLRPCTSLALPNCSKCIWECKLIKNPLELLHGCGESSTRHHPGTGQYCQGDVLEFLESFLKFGVQIEWDEAQDPYFTSCRACQSKNGVCGYNPTSVSKEFICFQSEERFSLPWKHQKNQIKVAVILTILAVISLLLACVLVIAVYRSRRMRSAADEVDPTTLFLHHHRSASLLPPVFTYEELETSTNRFDPKRKIGDGGFGSVYLGQLSDSRIVAVKYLHRHHHHAAAAGKSFSAKSFCNEILILSSIDHPILVKLHGYCSDPRGLILVYDYVPNGTLADHLHGPKSLYRKASLTWQVRLDIALQTALAIEYLHFSVQPAIVHRDITSCNIFVEKDMRIKVGDFGLSRLLVFSETTNTTSSSSSSGYVWTGPQGTPGYLDPDYHRSFRLTEKSDVYSFGVVLLELISGLKPVDQSRDKREVSLADLVVMKIQMGMLYQVIDPVLALDGDARDGVEAVAELAFRCVAADKDDRPDAREVVEELKRIRNGVRSTLRGCKSDSSVVVPVNGIVELRDAHLGSF